ncbi:MAG: tRNA pseudouridine(55) synthase TruB, partial [Coriobacteriales bacterium]|nr:tRNA pseudouridine(55) synthase TruB [Coriobacteriales bacterium]
MPRPRRGATSLNAVLAVDKPAGLTSHDVVDRVRRLTGEGRVGHAGTLDPMATGLLLVCVGPACRRSDELMGERKVYEARVVFGTATDTDDAEGKIVAQA